MLLNDADRRAEPSISGRAERGFPAVEVAVGVAVGKLTFRARMPPLDEATKIGLLNGS